MSTIIKDILEKESGVVEIVKNIYIAPISIIFKKDKICLVDVIVNCTKDKYTSDPDVDISTKTYYNVPIDDTGRQENIDNFVTHTKDILPDVLNDYKNGKIILVHCSQGVQRSAAFIVIMLVKLFDISIERAVEIVLEKKHNCFFHGRQINFKESLLRLI